MAKPNYSFEKRQRELAKKKKKEEKRAARAAGGGGTDEMTPNEAMMELVGDAPPAEAAEAGANDAADGEGKTPPQP